MLKYSRGYWETTKIFLLNIFNNEIIPDENFPDYGILKSLLLQGLKIVMDSIYIAMSLKLLWSSPDAIANIIIFLASCCLKTSYLQFSYACDSLYTAPCYYEWDFPYTLAYVMYITISMYIAMYIRILLHTH